MTAFHDSARPLASEHRLTGTTTSQLSRVLVNFLGMLAHLSDVDGFWLRPLVAESANEDRNVEHTRKPGGPCVPAVCGHLLILLTAQAH